MNWLERKVADYEIGRIQGELVQSGWKGKLGAVGVALGAVAACINDVANGTLTAEKGIAYFTAISGALAAFGIRDAIGKTPPL